MRTPDGPSGAAKPSRGLVDIAVIRLPRISNFTDFNPLACLEQVSCATWTVWQSGAASCDHSARHKEHHGGSEVAPGERPGGGHLPPPAGAARFGHLRRLPDAGGAACLTRKGWRPEARCRAWAYWRQETVFQGKRPEPGSGPGLASPGNL